MQHMIYTSELGSQHRIEVENRDGQTRITLSSHGPGSSQSQSSTVPTGRWTGEPTLHRAEGGHRLRLDTEQGPRDIHIGAGGIRLVEAPAPTDEPGEALRPSHSSPPPASSPAPKPMEPMRMGSMEMRPGEMRMGNMRMSLNEPEPAPPQAEQVLAGEHEATAEPGEPRKGRFCTQCGEPAQREDRFCGACGHKLRPAA